MNGEQHDQDRERDEREGEEIPPPEPPPPPIFGFRTAHEPEGGWEEGFPRVYFSVFERQAPWVVLNQAEDDAINHDYWIGMQLTPLPPPEGEEVAPVVDDGLTDAQRQLRSTGQRRVLQQ